MLEPASPRENRGDISWVVSTPMPSVPAPQLKPRLLVRFESAGAYALHILPFGFNPENAAMRTQGIGV